ncbi:ParB/RepB/Spo0J family partition protein [Bdellovibrionota bacterium FG-2]
MGQKQVLGKGLASLFPGMGSSVGSSIEGQAQARMAATMPASASAQDTANRDRHMGISVVAIEAIEVNQYQPRRGFNDDTLAELAQSIRTSGLIQPLVVRKSHTGAIELIAGERRLRAAKLAGLKQVPIVIRRSTDREALELALIENIQRENLNCVDEGLAYQQLIEDFSLTQDEVATRVGKDRASVANYLRVIKLPEAILDDLRRQILSFGHAKALLTIDDNEQRLLLRAKIVQEKLSVREIEGLVSKMKTASTQTAPPPSFPEPPTLMGARLNAVSQELTRKWSTKVEIKGNDRRGKMVFHYSTRQELDRLIEAMQNSKV